MAEGIHQIGIIGLGVMGRNLALNFADHGYAVAGFDQNDDQVSILNGDAGGRQVQGTAKLEEFISMLAKPRNILMLVPAGAPVDAVIEELLPNLGHEDLIIDGGNSHFTDTNTRYEKLKEKGMHYLGVGISGGESGARHGPSMMPGGSREAYPRVREMLEKASAKVDGEPCVAFLGPGSAGHYVKMVHNGIEYGIMQLLAESYDLMQRGLGLSAEALHEVYQSWNEGELNSFLVEITAAVFDQIDPETGKHLIDVILDEARQKGTGKWTSQDAMELQVPTPTIDAAVMMRNMSGWKGEREKASRMHGNEIKQFAGDRDEILVALRRSVYACMILTYAQGFAQLFEASNVYHYDLDLERVARIWRGGCIIRSRLLEKIRSAYKKAPDLTNLFLDPVLGGEVVQRSQALRRVVEVSARLAIPMPGHMASLGYLDAYRSGWLPANLIQAQRDYFGSHKYERLDKQGVFHTQWGG